MTLTPPSFMSALQADIMHNFVVLTRDYAECKDYGPSGTDLEELLLVLMSDRKCLKRVLAAGSDSEDRITVRAEWLEPPVAQWFATEFLSWPERHRIEATVSLRNHLHGLIFKERTRRLDTAGGDCEAVGLFAELCDAFGSPQKEYTQQQRIKQRRYLP